MRWLSSPLGEINLPATHCRDQAAGTVPIHAASSRFPFGEAAMTRGGGVVALRYRLLRPMHPTSRPGGDDGDSGADGNTIGAPNAPAGGRAVAGSNPVSRLAKSLHVELYPSGAQSASGHGAQPGTRSSGLRSASAPSKPPDQRAS